MKKNTRNTMENSGNARKLKKHNEKLCEIKKNTINTMNNCAKPRKTKEIQWTNV